MITNYKHQTKTKLISFSDAGAPELKNIYGNLNNLLKIVLTEGFNTKIIESFTSGGDTLEIILPINHGYKEDSVIKISGCSDPILNKEFRILSTTSISIKIYKPEGFVGEVVAPFGETSLAPLGYSNIFEDVDSGVLCLKSASTRTPAILRIIDKLPPNGYATTWAKYGRVTIGQEIDANGFFINNVKSPYHPEFIDCEEVGDKVSGAGGIHGFAKWDYSIYPSDYHTIETNPANGVFPTNWYIIGDDKTFYLMINSQGKNKYGANLLGFGEYFTYNPEETYNICLQARDGFLAANNGDQYSYSRTRSFFGALNRTYSGFIFKNIYNDHKSGYGRSTNISTMLSASYRDRPWFSSGVKNTNPFSGEWLSAPLILKDFDNYVRGVHRGISISLGTSAYKPGYSDEDGTIVMEVGDPISASSYNASSIMFTLKDWEYNV